MCHICGLTQTGKQAALLRKPQNHPTEKFRAAVREREWESARERERHHSWQFGGRSLGCAAYLFGWLLPLSENKHVPVIWQHSGRTGQRSALKTLTLYGSFSSHICTVTVRLHNIHKQFSFLSFFWLMALSKGPCPPVFAHQKRSLRARHCDWPPGAPAVYSVELCDTIASYMWSELCQQTKGTSRPIWACCHLKAAK